MGCSFGCCLACLACVAFIIFGCIDIVAMEWLALWFWCLVWLGGCGVGDCICLFCCLFSVIGLELVLATLVFVRCLGFGGFGLS